MSKAQKIPSGLSGLDEILEGGLIPQKAYLVQGGPGSGKSTLGLHFLSEASKNDGNALYITLGETEKSVRKGAEQYGIDLSNISFLDLSPRDNLDENPESYNVFSPQNVEQEPIIEAISDAIKEQQPDRVLLDSITMLRLLNNDPYKMRKMALSLISFITEHGATLVMVSETVEEDTEKDATFWVDGIIHLKPGSSWRKIRVSKFRGAGYRAGNHAFKITDNGMTVYPRLQPNKYDSQFESQTLSSGIEEIDELLNGGIEKGTTNLIVGATGVGKTNLGLQFIKEAAARDHRSVLYTFEESKELIVRRSEMINTPIKKMLDSGNLNIKPIEPLSYSPDEFSKMVRSDVEDNGTRMVMIDSMGGYDLAVREGKTLERLHSLTVYLKNMGVTTLLVNESQNITGKFTATTMNASYLTDSIIFLRYLEINGELRKAIGILKKRMSGFEKTIREFEITPDGVKVGDPLKNMHGILTGLPEVED